ncbi:MAG: glycosyltransferase family 4 protein [Candidatus Omnitrophica bacterium]|nr:glycosyltransferase family 4 protein [Candidatus Omnitrophota bacterium]
MAVGFILSQFPRYDEAFILRELVELSKGEEATVIFSLRPCRDKVVHEQAKPLQKSTVYAPFFFSADVWRSHLAFLRSTPAWYAGALGWVVSRHWKNPVVLLKSVAFFPKTVHFARIAREKGVSHLHAFWATYPATAAVVINRLTGIPFSMSGHAHDIYTANPALAEKVREARFTLTCTEYNRGYLSRIAKNGTGDKVFVSYHGVDLERFAPAQKPGNGVCQILSVGSLLPCKGYETLIESCRILKESRFPFRCTIAGGGFLERKLRGMIRRYGLAGQMAIVGYVSQETVADFYRQADLFVLPLVSKIHWGIPNVLIEALASKTPVISCDLPSLRELVEHGKSGWIIPEESPEALADAVKKLWYKPALRRSLAEVGHQRVRERFSLERTGRQLREIFQRSIGERIAAGHIE